MHVQYVCTSVQIYIHIVRLQHILRMTTNGVLCCVVNYTALYYVFHVLPTTGRENTKEAETKSAKIQEQNKIIKMKTMHQRQNEQA